MKWRSFFTHPFLSPPGRLREKNSNNTKHFIDERKAAANKQNNRREKLKKIHEAQANDLQKYIQSVSDMLEEKNTLERNP